MKKFLALLLTLTMVLTLCVFTATAEAVDPDTIEDTMTSADGTYELAFVTDVGQLKDKSFNQGTWNGVKSYAAANNMSYKYYQPANGDQATDDDRYDAMKAAADAGAKVIVAAGFMQGTALTKAAIEFSDVKFVFIDGWTLTDAAGAALTNVAPIAFQEEQCGYFAGYAVVKEGYTKLGFSGGGGGNNPACCRYGYGFVQGANAAAAEMGTEVEMNYSWLYGASFSASPELQTMANGWYENGTEVIFACGGSMFASITAAAAENDAFVVGVDSDQSFDSETVITSALKGVGEAASWAIGKFYANEWDEIGGVGANLGAKDGATGIPTATWMLKNYTVEEYEAQFAAVKDGTLVIDADYEANLTQEYSNLKLNIIE
ncbi:MAG: BMP family ABC transporter substrate-binding protein [Eubacteriales bacterium]|nr:BMP family ABC transporter substrate-binding protein [Eubacteriales bacterium]